jgi:tRNA nucleotidyltransferase (CCA-adding enzyme)
MKIYLVGGAVRDYLLNRPVTEKDYVVVGATPEQMLAQGFKPVGQDFPVFLHPQTHAEYALARTERKVAPGYQGFQFHASPEVTLEEDLLRRDLTINAMAMDEGGTIVDPLGGQKDIQARQLRHVSEAFSEDPVRILRIARFYARFAEYGFTIAPATVRLMRAMVKNGEVDALVAERVWQEWQRALGEKNPEKFFQALRYCGALKKLIPELDLLYGVPAKPKYHPEIDSGVHTCKVLQQAVQLSQDPQVRFAAVLHDLGKGLTPVSQWPSHKGHEKQGVALVQQVCKRFKAPKDYAQLARLVTEFHGLCHRALELRPATIYDFLKQLDAFRRPQRFQQFLLACKADSQGRPGFEHNAYPQAQWLQDCVQAAQQVKVAELLDEGYKGPALGEQIRLQAIGLIAHLNKPT